MTAAADLDLTRALAEHGDVPIPLFPIGAPLDPEESKLCPCGQTIPLAAGSPTRQPAAHHHLPLHLIGTPMRVATREPAAPRRLLTPTPLDKSRTETVRNRHTGLDEIWRAYSVALTPAGEPLWTYQREEDTGSTWSVRHGVDGAVWYGEQSLLAARRGTASGWILAQLQERPASVSA